LILLILGFLLNLLFFYTFWLINYILANINMFICFCRIKLSLTIRALDIIVIRRSGRWTQLSNISTRFLNLFQFPVVFYCFQKFFMIFSPTSFWSFLYLHFMFFFFKIFFSFTYFLMFRYSVLSEISATFCTLNQIFILIIS